MLSLPSGILEKKERRKTEMDLSENLKHQKALSQFVKGIDRREQAIHNYASKHEEDVYRVLALIRSVYSYELPFDQMDKALIHLALSPGILYDQLSTGYETQEITALTGELDLPPGSLHCREPIFDAAEVEAAMQGLVDPTVPKHKQQPPLLATRPASKTPFYQKNRAQWWKGKKNV